MIHVLLPTFAVASALCSVALLGPTAEAHQMLLSPPPFWLSDDKAIRYNPLAFLENQGFKTQENFTDYRIKNKFKDLRDFLDHATYTVVKGARFDSGFTDGNGKPPRPIPKDGLIRSTGYTHDGPCQVYLDDKMVLESENCHNSFPGKSQKIDYSSCKSQCKLYWFWLGIRFLKDTYSWQVYKAIVPLSENGTEPTPSEK